MNIADQIENLKTQADVGLRCSVVGPDGPAQWFVAKLRGIEIAQVHDVYLAADGASAKADAWTALMAGEAGEGDAGDESPGFDLSGVRVVNGRPNVLEPADEVSVFFDLLDVLEAPLPSSGVLVVGSAGCQLLGYFLSQRIATDSATDALFELFSFFSEAQKREQRLALRLDELRRAYHDVERQLAETFFTHEFFKALTVYEPLRSVAGMVVDGTLGIMGAESCALYIKADNESQTLGLYGSQGQNLEAYPDTLPADPDWVDRHLRSTDGSFTPLVRPEVFREMFGGSPGLGAVLFRKDDLLGLLIVTSEDIAYGPLELERFMSVGGMAGLSLQNVLLHEEIEKRSITDQLTGLYNHRFFQQILEQEFLRARNTKAQMSMIMIDLDFFKELNDTYGHLLGDMFLRRVGEAIRSAVRESDIPARYGGDEFALVLPGTALGGAEVVARKIFDAVREITIDVPDGVVADRTVSVGVAALEADCHVPKDLFDRADQALYVAKENGRSQIRVYRSQD
ncbi:MAG: GGDEF domain-containing protein [Actinobacteria bacterium]|nr:GGDEF domain-containing protein [Actinomycetota bacterium]